jgi:NAD(P)H dehydrogenase (quinone)
MSILITGATGQFGRFVTDLLLERVPASDLILVTRNPAALAQLSARGATVRRADFDEPDTLAAAFAGADRMLLISTLSVGRRAEQHQRAIDAAAAAGVRHIVYTSSGGADPANPAIVIADHLGTEAALKKSGVSYTILRDSLYAEVVAVDIAGRALATGKWITCAGEGRCGFVSKADCVAVAATVLTTPGHEGATYEVTGPETLSFRDAARMASEVAGRPIDYVVVDAEELDALLADAGVPRHYVEGMFVPGVGTSSRQDIVSYELGIRAGYFAVKSDHVQKVLGRPPKSLREVLLANRRSETR